MSTTHKLFITLVCTPENFKENPNIDQRLVKFPELASLLRDLFLVNSEDYDIKLHIPDSYIDLQAYSTLMKEKEGAVAYVDKLNDLESIYLDHLDAAETSSDLDQLPEFKAKLNSLNATHHHPAVFPLVLEATPENLCNWVDAMTSVRDTKVADNRLAGMMTEEHKAEFQKLFPGVNYQDQFTFLALRGDEFQNIIFEHMKSGLGKTRSKMFDKVINKFHKKAS